MQKLFFLSKGELYKYSDGKVSKLESEAVKKYEETLKDMKKRKVWKDKTSDMHILNMMYGLEKKEEVLIKDIKVLSNDKLLYSVNFEKTTGIYSRNTDVSDKTEDLIIRNNNFLLYEIDVSEKSQKIVASFTDDYSESHILLLDSKTAEYHILTEGGSLDRNPVFDKNDDSIIYYDCSNIGYNSDGNPVAVSNRYITRLDISTAELEDIVSNSKFDYFKPQFDNKGNFYCIKRPYAPSGSNKKMTFLDVLLIPFKFFKAIFNFLDFFTARYTGERLNTAGKNPAKMQEKTDKEIFIEGNLIDVHETLSKNKGLKEKYPGVIPKSWVLIKYDLNNNEETVLKKGVLGYVISDDGTIFYSNGKYIIKSDEANDEAVHEIDFAEGLSV